jgi:hypothetical protein
MASFDSARLAILTMQSGSHPAETKNKILALVFGSPWKNFETFKSLPEKFRPKSFLLSEMICLI